MRKGGEESMVQNRMLSRLFAIGVAVIMLFSMFLALRTVNQVQNYGRVINYTGVVRGSVQRIVKSELSDVPRDELIGLVEGVLTELKDGGTRYGIVPIKNSQEYQDLLADATVMWAQLKSEIAAVRAGAGHDRLFQMSEEMFVLCDKATFAAERYSQEQVAALKRDMLVAILLLVAASAAFWIWYWHNARQLRRSAAELVALSECVPGGIQQVRLDDMRTLEYVSDGLLSMTGYTRQELHRQFHDGLIELVPEAERAEVRAEIARQLLHGDVMEVDYHLKKKSGGLIHILEKGKVLSSDKSAQLCSVLVDLTQRETEKLSRLQNEERYRIIMKFTQDIVFEWDIKDKMAYCSPNFEKKFGYVLPENNLFSYTDSVRVAEEDKEAFREFSERFSVGDADYEELECRLLTAGGDPVWCAIRATSMKDENGATERVVGILSDINAQKLEILRLEKQAQLDGLTGIFNKKTTEDSIRSYLDGEGYGMRHVLYILDIDDFKIINDKGGHKNGDKVLKILAARLQCLFRDEDIVGRIGGDEFMVLVKSVTDESIALRRAQMICEIFSGPTREELSCEASVSVGAALYPDDSDDYESLCLKADIALYRSKQLGKNCVTLFHNMTQQEKDDISFEMAAAPQKQHEA